MRDPEPGTTETPAQTGVPGEADGRTRTGDPFITSDGAESHPVTTGHTESPAATPETAGEDPERPGERPQDAPTKATQRGLRDDEAFVFVRDYAVVLARATLLLDLDTIEQAIAAAEHAQALCPILDPTLAGDAGHELAQQIRLMHHLRTFRIAIEAFRPEEASG